MATLDFKDNLKRKKKKSHSSFVYWFHKNDIFRSIGLNYISKNPPANAGDTKDVGSIPGWGRYPGEGNDNPLQYSCWENSMDRGNWWATVHGAAETRT